MKFDWSEYFNLANELIKTDANEAKQRSSISRAYYAAFCIAKNYLRDNLGDPSLSKKNPDINLHQYVAKEFREIDPRNKKMTEIARDLTLLRTLRNNADYEDTIFSLQKNTQMSLQLAQNIIDNVNKLNKEIK